MTIRLALVPPDESMVMEANCGEGPYESMVMEAIAASDGDTFGDHLVPSPKA